MKKRVLIIIAGIAALLTACIPSVNPFYDKKDLVHDTKLLGEWLKDNDTWKFEDGGDKSYKLTIDENSGKHGEMSAHLFKLKKQLYMDLIPTKLDLATNTPDIISVGVFPGHLLVAVKELGATTLKATFLDYDELKKLLEANPSALAHRTEDGGMLLTASTPELQKFVIKYETNFFNGAPDEWTRKTAGAAPSK